MTCDVELEKSREMRVMTLCGESAIQPDRAT